MRLLHTQSHTLKEFAHGKIPRYAILSHTWEEGREVLYQDFGPGKTPSSKPGWSKISGFCIKAQQDDLDWAWVDTCCIDKSSSTELSEAINSMYRWYQDAEICYAYLTDVTRLKAASGSAIIKLDDGTGKKTVYDVSDFTCSRWFKRGWTLQELISPCSVEFFTLEWDHIGSKHSLAKDLEKRTGIPRRVLIDVDSPRYITVAQRMAWAAGRETTRPEDEAYCLLGLFGVHMPLLYGEGRVAFQRLQQQIIMQEEDYSLLAWTDELCNTSRLSCLAPQPVSFQKVHTASLSYVIESYSTCYSQNYAAWTNRCEGARISLEWAPEAERKLSPGLMALGIQDTESFIEQLQVEPSPISHRDEHEMRPPEMTSRGLRISLYIRSAEYPAQQSIAWTYCMLLNEPLCIMLEPLKTAHGTVYMRSRKDLLFTVSWSLLNNEFSPREVYLTVREPSRWRPSP